nr:hypothetical protein [Tanacetum cinerariifolium]
MVVLLRLCICEYAITSSFWNANVVVNLDLARGNSYTVFAAMARFIIPRVLAGYHLIVFAAMLDLGGATWNPACSHDVPDAALSILAASAMTVVIIVVAVIAIY